MIEHLVICSKSTWDPAIRREHALALLAASDGLDVTFVERPGDIRLISSPRARAWLTNLARGSQAERVSGLDVRMRSTLLPPHWGSGTQRLEMTLLARELRRASRGSATTLLATAPWQWSAVSRTPAGRRVFDCADDWSVLMPARRGVYISIYERVAREADAIAVASEGLASLFPGREVTVVRNGTSAEMLRDPIRSTPDDLRMIYAGTLSNRFDTDVVRHALLRDPGWRLELYGECQYARRGERPNGELHALLAAFRGRAEWYGPVARSLLAELIDASRVCLLPHRRWAPARSRRRRPDGANARGAPSWRGDAMKFYDYAARGRPVVSTCWADDLFDVGPPHLYLAGSAEEFGDAITAASEEPARYAEERRAWAKSQAWERRWPRWRAVIRGDGPAEGR